MLLVSASWANDDPLAQLVRNDISNDARDALVDRLKQADFAATAQRILQLMHDGGAQHPGVYGEKPWRDKSLKHKDKVWYAADEIWRGLVGGKPNPAKTAVLLELLARTKDEDSRYRVIMALENHWTADVERQFVELVNSENTTDYVKLDLLRVLLRSCGDPYIDRAIQLVKSVSVESRGGYFRGLFNVANRFFKYSQEHQRDLIDLGFTILETEAKDKDPHAAYFTACQLEYFLGDGKKFKPDQKAPQYQGRYGLTDQFFADTVQRVLEWRRANPGHQPESTAAPSSK